MQFIKIDAPFDKDKLRSLKAGDYVYLNGDIYTARDAAHKRIVDCLDKNVAPPIELDKQIIYYVGPCYKDGVPTSAGPTTSTRMDKYAPALYDRGVIATIGKGDRTPIVYQSIKDNGAVYFAAIGGAGAIYAQAIKDSALIAYPELGAEAIYRFTVHDFPVIVAIDSFGNSIYNR